MKRPGLQPGDSYLFSLLEYQAGKTMDEAVLENFTPLLEDLNKQAPEGEPFHRIDDATVQLPCGSYVQISWKLEVIPQEEGERLEQEMAEETNDE